MDTKNAAMFCSIGLVPSGGAGGGGGRDFSFQVVTLAPPTAADLLHHSDRRHQVGNFQAQPCFEMFCGSTHRGSSQQFVMLGTENIVAKLHWSLAMQRAAQIAGGSPPWCTNVLCGPVLGGV